MDATDNADNKKYVRDIIVYIMISVIWSYFSHGIVFTILLPETNTGDVMI